MDPVEAGEWLVGRPQQLVFLTGLDPNNKESHSALVSTFGSLMLDSINIDVTHPLDNTYLKFKFSMKAENCLWIASLAVATLFSLRI
ncbi:hypothetical protein ANCDUO_09473 [Ancylostoma duodenale]|uniref:Uncharacterized protein n=1 Tax=Ancylostoma duodenale TaxID=51022 RepID=A0A0C2CTQ2_9BILA|nr:hypothetical protein ANCDUO_09473 [Ancylostoma duodenale]